MTALVCVVGSVNLDLIFDVDALPRPGETVLAVSARSGRSAPGGKGGNQAVAAARAGARVQFVGALGDDAAADQLRTHLSTNGIGLDGTVDLPGPSGTAIIVVDSERREHHRGSTRGQRDTSRWSNPALRAVVRNCDVLLTQLEIPVPTAVAAAREARSAGAVVMVNASPAGGDSRNTQALAELAALADVIITNEAEAGEWRWPSAHFVVTLGARGARYVGADGEFDGAGPGGGCRGHHRGR